MTMKNLTDKNKDFSSTGPTVENSNTTEDPIIALDLSETVFAIYPISTNTPSTSSLDSDDSECEQ
jgi:hypothetical protein